MEKWSCSMRLFFSVFLPPALWLFLFLLVPFFLMWLYSLGENTGVVGVAVTGTLRNYAKAWEPFYLDIIWRSFWMAGIATFITLIVAWPVALFISFSEKRMRPWMLLVIVLPFWTNLLVRTYALMDILRRQGYVNDVLSWFYVGAGHVMMFFHLAHSPWPPFHAPQLLYTKFAVIAGLVYTSLPFMVFPIYASLEKFDRFLIEASLDLGATHMRTFFSIVVPMTISGILSGCIITFIPAFGSYLIPAFMGGVKSHMIANVIAEQFKQANNWPFGSALSFLIMYITFFILALGTLGSKRRTPL